MFNFSWGPCFTQENSTSYILMDALASLTDPLKYQISKLLPQVLVHFKIYIHIGLQTTEKFKTQKF